MKREFFLRLHRDRSSGRRMRLYAFTLSELFDDSKTFLFTLQCSLNTRTVLPPLTQLFQTISTMYEVKRTQVRQTLPFPRQELKGTQCFHCKLKNIHISTFVDR